MEDKNSETITEYLNQSRYHLTLNEQYLLLAAISGIDSGNRKGSRRITMQNLNILLESDQKISYIELKKAAKRLLSRTLLVQEPDGELNTHWIEHVKYYDQKESIDLSLSSKLIPFLPILKQKFMADQGTKAIRFKSIYSVRIYEMLKRSQDNEFKLVTLDELRRTLNILNGKLNRYTDLRRYVLDVAQKELANSDLRFRYEPKKISRKVVGIEFTIISNKKRAKKHPQHRRKDNRSITNTIPQNHEIDLLQQEQRKKTQLTALQEKDPQRYAKLKKQAKKRLTHREKNGQSASVFIEAKMMDLLQGFLQREKITL